MKAYGLKLSIDLRFVFKDISIISSNPVPKMFNRALLCNVISAYPFL